MALLVFASIVFLLSLNSVIVVDAQEMVKAICPQCLVAPCPCPFSPPTIRTPKPVTVTPCQDQMCIDVYCYYPFDPVVAARRKRQAEQLIAESGCGCPPIPTCPPPVTEITTTTPFFVPCPLFQCAQVLCAAPSRRRRQIAEEKIISTYNCTGCPPPTCPPVPVLETA